MIINMSNSFLFEIIKPLHCLQYEAVFACLVSKLLCLFKFSFLQKELILFEY